jgi:uncharacterized membrane protein YgdD (TMEM256/DUF423 family)
MTSVLKRVDFKQIKKMDKKIILGGLFLGIISIILGAFGAHALKKILTIAQLASFEIGVRYMMYHGLFLLFVGTFQLITAKQKKLVFYLSITGIIFFSGSIFLLSLGNIIGINLKFIGPITPLGGLLLIGSWIVVFYNILIKKT